MSNCRLDVSPVNYPDPVHTTGKYFSLGNIHIFIAIALDETSILVAVHFSMKNICQ